MSLRTCFNTLSNTVSNAFTHLQNTGTRLWNAADSPLSRLAMSVAAIAIAYMTPSTPIPFREAIILLGTATACVLCRDIYASSRPRSLRETVLLAESYFRGVSPEDHAEAFRLFSNAADRGSLEAESFLGWMYLKGIGVAQDVDKGRELLQQSADQGDYQAQLLLGYLYRDGTDGAPQNFQKAQKLYTLAATQRDQNDDHSGSEAHACLGSMYERGTANNGAGVDSATALEHFRRAADLPYTQDRLTHHGVA